MSQHHILERQAPVRAASPSGIPLHSQLTICTQDLCDDAFLVRLTILISALPRWPSDDAAANGRSRR